MFLPTFVRTYNAGLSFALFFLFFFLLYFLGQNTAFSTNFTMLSAAQHIVPLNACNLARQPFINITSLMTGRRPEELQAFLRP
jgi:hypothetical protein